MPAPPPFDYDLGSNPITAPSPGAAGAAGADGNPIPAAAGRKRLSPALDPLARMRLSALAKWMLVTGILVFILATPFFFYQSAPDGAKVALAQKAVQDAGDGPDQVRAGTALKLAQNQLEADRKAATRSQYLDVLAAAVLSAIFATGLPRLLLPGVFGRWHEAVEAARDWLVVGLVTGGLYIGILALLKSFKAPPGEGPMANLVGLSGASNAMFDPVWLTYRLPFVLIAALLGLMLSRRLALSAEGIVAQNAGKALGEMLMQAVVIGLLIRPIEFLFRAIGGTPFVGTLLMVVAFLLVAGAIAVISWAFDADQHAAALHRRGHPAMTGVDAGDAPVPMTLSVIGGRESGKTVLLAAAYYEWLTTPFGQLRIKPAPNGSQGFGGASGGSGGTDLEAIADELYVNNQFPVGTVSTQNLPFDIAYGREPVCRFSMLDFPGGAVVGRAADQQIIDQFWDRLENSDALLIIADMSYVRRGRKDPGFTQVFGAYVEAMRRLIDRNGKRRVVPVALVLTKCDEYHDPVTGRLDRDGIRRGMEEFGYSGLESTWRQMCQQEGQQIVEFSTWVTSAITFSEPQKDGNGEYDYSKPFKIIPPPPAITPAGCAAPILWLTAKVMRWNVTAFRDLSSFLFGSSPRQRRRLDAIIEIEQVAEQKQAHG